MNIHRMGRDQVSNPWIVEITESNQNVVLDPGRVVSGPQIQIENEWDRVRRWIWIHVSHPQDDFAANPVVTTSSSRDDLAHSFKCVPLDIPQQLHGSIASLHELDVVRPLVAKYGEDASTEKGLNRGAIPPLERLQPQSSLSALMPRAHTTARQLLTAIPHGWGLSAEKRTGECGHHNKRNYPIPLECQIPPKAHHRPPNNPPKSFPKTQKAPKHK